MRFIVREETAGQHVRILQLHFEGLEDRMTILFITHYLHYIHIHSHYIHIHIKAKCHHLQNALPYNDVYFSSLSTAMSKSLSESTTPRQAQA